MRTVKHECPSLNVVAKAAWGILFAFALSIIASSRAFAQEATSTASAVGSQDASISLSEIERINVFVKFLASNNVQEKILAIKVLEALALRKQFPPEFVPVLVHLYDTDKDSVVVQAAAGVLSIITNTDTMLIKSITPRVTIFIRNEVQRKAANGIAGSLKHCGFIVDVEKTSYVGEEPTYLSTFWFEQSGTLGLLEAEVEGDKIIKCLEQYDLQIDQMMVTDRYYLINTRPRHFMLWLAPSLTVLKKR